MSKTKKPIRKMYTLFNGVKGLTNQSNTYFGGGGNEEIYLVVAYSIRQAIYLGANEVWYDGNAGIVEWTNRRICRDFKGNERDNLRLGVMATKPVTKRMLELFE